jgi:polar amino acid transport system substrate-binding protein
MENFNICGTELDAGGVDAVVIDLPVAQNLASRFNGFVILETNLGSEQYGICFRNGDDELCKKFEDAIMKLVEDGTYLSLAQKYGLDENVLCLLNK